MTAGALLTGRAAFPIAGVNELEKVGDELWGNVYPMYQGKASECLVRLNATTGAVLGWVDMRGLREASCVGRDGTDPCRQRDEVRRSAHNFVFNGAACITPRDPRVYF
jgi:glutamine cyclotransferase